MSKFLIKKWPNLAIELPKFAKLNDFQKALTYFPVIFASPLPLASRWQCYQLSLFIDLYRCFGSFSKEQL